MATVPSPITWVAGNKVTAAQMNANVRDAVNFLLATPTAESYVNAAQSVANTAWSVITLDGNVLNNDTMWVSGTTITIKTAGTYLVSGQVTFAANTSGRRLGGINLNAFSSQPNVNQTEVMVATTGSATTTVPITARRLHLNVNDTLQLYAYQTSGASLSLVTGSSATFLSAQWVSNL